MCSCCTLMWKPNLFFLLPFFLKFNILLAYIIPGNAWVSLWHFHPWANEPLQSHTFVSSWTLQTSYSTLQLPIWFLPQPNTIDRQSSLASFICSEVKNYFRGRIIFSFDFFYCDKVNLKIATLVVFSAEGEWCQMHSRHGTCPGYSAAVIKFCHQKQLRGGKACLAHTSRSQFITEESWSRNLKQKS